MIEIPACIFVERRSVKPGMGNDGADIGRRGEDTWRTCTELLIVPDL